MSTHEEIKKIQLEKSLVLQDKNTIKRRVKR
jgi:hypothetical protein